MTTRRSFLQQSSLIALAPTVPGFLASSARAARPDMDGRVLVVIHLDGGNDGINTVVPYRDETYAENRSELKLAENQLLKISDDLALHPSMRAANALLDDSKLAIVQAVGYPNPNRSHFRSTAIWNTASFKDEGSGYGWVGRALDGGKVHHGADSIFVGQEKLPHALRGRRSVASSMLHNEDLTLDSPINPQSVVGGSDAEVDLSAFVRRSVLDAYTTADELSKATRKADSDARYPATKIATRLRLIAQLIKSGLLARVYYALQPGTHAFQLPTHTRLLAELSAAVKAFVEDLTAAHLADRVLVLTFSEFGRRVKENGSLGTDHGTAGPIFLAGTEVKAGVIGEPPRLTELVDGDLNMQFDFRKVYATLLEEWLGIESRPVLGGDFRGLQLFSKKQQP